MIKTIFSTVVGKFLAVALLLSGVLGGMAATGALPGFGQSPTYSVASVNQAHPSGPGVALDFPTSVLAAPAVQAAAEEVVEEVVVVQAPRTAPAPASVAPPAPAAPKCVTDITTVLNAITAAIPTITTGEQGQMLLAQTNAVLEAANGCVAEAKQIGFPGLDAVNQLVVQADGLVTQIQALPAVASLTPAQLAETPNLLNGVGQVVGGTLNVVSRGLGLLGTGLNYLGGGAK
ncbi:MAG TPA: hypothetical protein VHI31_07975 [Actinomycetota bacterium]|nr:hypothetical protein [Actinomycetota bacterium]